MANRGDIDDAVYQAQLAGWRLVYDALTNAFNTAANIYNSVLYAKAAILNGWLDATRFLPWPLSDVGSWLTNTLWYWLGGPIYDWLIRAAHLPVAALDILWDYGAQQWWPAMRVFEVLGILGRPILWVYDAIGDVTGIVQSAIGSVIYAITNWVRSITNPIEDTLYWVGQWINQTFAQWSAGVVNAINRQADELYYLGRDIDTIMSNPPAWIWAQLEPTLRSRAADWLRRIW